MENGNQVTVEELKACVEKTFELRRTYDKLKKESDKAYAEFQALSVKTARMLETLELDKFQSPSGTLSYGYDESWRTPKSPEQKAAFYAYLKDKGLFDEMISVNSRSLNSFAKAEEMAALEAGILDFQIPGLEKGTPAIKPIMRKK